MHERPPLRSEAQRHLVTVGWRLRFAAAVVAVAAGAAAFAMAFREATRLLYARVFHARDVLELFRELPAPARVVVPIAGAFLAALAANRASRVPGQSVGAVMEAIALGKPRLSTTSTTWKALGSWLAIGTGNSVGREGPLIQFGGSLGFLIGTRIDAGGEHRAALVAAGTAAGFAAAYNTPFAAVLFVVEVMRAPVRAATMGPILFATAISTALVRWLVGGGPIYGQRAFSSTTIRELVAHAALGVVAALVAQIFMRTLTAGEQLQKRLAVPQPWRAALGAVVVGALALVIPEVVGNGYEPLNVLLDEHYAVRIVAWLVVAKVVATTASVSTGSPGGVFTPTLLVGGGVGLLWGSLVASAVGAPGSQGGYALVGMAAMIAATTHAPLMASVLVFELSGDYAIVLPLLLATALASTVSRLLRSDSIYAAELREHRAAREAQRS